MAKLDENRRVRRLLNGWFFAAAVVAAAEDAMEASEVIFSFSLLILYKVCFVVPDP